MADSIYRPNGGYKHLLTYQKAEIIFDLTFLFCHRYLQKSDRTFDQMIQAARSGKQNIAEGSLAAATSAATEIHLTNVARASLEELLLDYQDYLRSRKLTVWQYGSKEQLFMRSACIKHNDSKFFLDIAQTRNDQVIANMAICLLKQCTVLLYRQLQALEENFLKNGGFRENMYRIRSEKR